tara:strand:+ start:910 stop:1173 length:264 start_codon:yes stop_codon:yes gene_type:complete
MSKEGNRIRELIEAERDLRGTSTPDEQGMECSKVIIQMQPIEFNTFVGHQPPTREEVGRAIIQMVEDNNFFYTELIKHKKEEVSDDA